MASTTDMASSGSVSRLPTTAPSSPPSETALSNDAERADDGHGAVSKEMVKEEKDMEQAALAAERDRSDRLRKEREDEMQQGNEAVDIKFKRLQYLLGQSEVRKGGLTLFILAVF